MFENTPKNTAMLGKNFKKDTFFGVEGVKV